MRKAFVITLASILLLIVLMESGTLNSLLVFLLVGAIPGTTYAVPAGVMLLIIAVCVWLAIARFAALNLLRNSSLRRLAKHHIETKKRMPRHRYARLTQNSVSPN